MALDIGTIKSGFKITAYEFIEDVGSHVYMMEHLRSGARLMYLGNEDDNKVFSIAFRTPVSDDTGVPHILEHSVLCGSRKYPLKEPFVELVKGSLNTFLNAMTYSDKTVYPVASRNEKDFFNLMDVYLDAVFYPLIYDNEYTLLQEGWHYNIEFPEGELSYNGVVYSEMKGVYSAPEAELERQTMRALFPDTTYRFESGGHPEAIPRLTQEDFEKFHRKFYVPENSYIYLYGDMDIEKTLSYLDREYLSKFTKTASVDSSVQLQKPFPRTMEAEAYYAVDQGAELSGKTYHELSIVTGKSSDIKTILAMRLLQAALLESEGAPLKKALLQAGVAQNISCSLSTSMLQPVFSITASGSDREQKDKFLSVIYKTLQDITINGLDKKLLEAAVNSLEFKVREADFGSYPKGLIWGLGVMDVWIYREDPLECFHFNKYLTELRQAIQGRYYERLIENYLLDNTHRALVTLLPKPGKEEMELSAMKQRMEELKASMSEDEISSHIYRCGELRRLQALEDSPEAKETIPLLKRSDIKREAEIFPTEEEHIGDSTLLYLEAVTNKIVYIRYYFDVTGVESSLLPFCNLFVDILGKLDTKNCTYEEIATSTIMYTGGISFDLRAVSEADDADKYRIYFILKTKVMIENLEKLFSILKNIATETMFTDLGRFREVVAELKTSWDSEFFNRGQSVAISRLNAYSSAAARVNEQDQYSYYKFLTELLEDFNSKGEAALRKIKEIAGMFFNQNKYLLAYSCEAGDRKTVRDACLNFTAALPLAVIDGSADIMTEVVVNEAITTSGKVQYVAAGGNFVKRGHNYTGVMKVLETILKYEYLWSAVRVQGGAYGATAVFSPNGTTVLASYRDPQLLKTLATYKELPVWLAEKNFEARELDKYVIGTISTMDVPLTNSMKLDKAIARKLNAKPCEYYQRIRNEILDVRAEDLRALAKVLEDTLSNGYVCVVGGKETIEANRDIFNKIINV